jgi:hypothetical protein
MRLYRFSPISDEKQLVKAILHVHLECMNLCEQAIGEYLPVAGNMGIFCHHEDEYEYLTQLRKQLTVASKNPDQKYFKLKKPIVIEEDGNVPEAIYTHLYIRKPDIYRAQVGDVDFVMEEERYRQMKTALEGGQKIPGARIFSREDLDMVELYDPDVDALGYISVRAMTEKVRIKVTSS